MNAPTAELTVFRAPNFACVRIAGRANFACGPDFKRTVDELIGLRPTRLVMDLEECQLMDSTFLGVLAGEAEHFHQDVPGDGLVELSNPSPRVIGLIESLGVGKWFQHTAGKLDLPESVQAKRIPLLSNTKIELKQTSLAAHENLSQVSDANRARFAEITRTLREDLEHLLSGGAPSLPGFDMAAINRQAGKVGGDFYDFAPLSGLRVAALIADVSGKGASAAQVVAQCRPFLRDELSRDRSPAAVFRSALSLVPTLPEDMFLTALCVVVNSVTHSFRVARAGHDPLLWFHAATGKVELLQPKGMALGIERTGLEQATFVEREFQLGEGDVLLMHTDGITESLSPAGEEFGCERLKRMLAEIAGLDAQRIAAKTFAAVAEFTQHSAPQDDRTLVVIKAL